MLSPVCGCWDVPSFVLSAPLPHSVVSRTKAFSGFKASGQSRFPPPTPAGLTPPGCGSCISAGRLDSGAGRGQEPAMASVGPSCLCCLHLTAPSTVSLSSSWDMSHIWLLAALLDTSYGACQSSTESLLDSAGQEQQPSHTRGRHWLAVLGSTVSYSMSQ